MRTRKAYTIVTGDARTPINAVLKNGNGDPIDIGSLTVKVVAETSGGTVSVSETTTGITNQPTQTFTVDTTKDEVICVGHGLIDGDQIVVSSTTTLPGGLAASTRYFVRSATPNRLAVTDRPMGAPIDITSSGTGTHTMYLVGHVQWVIPSAVNGTSGEYLVWFTVYDGGGNKDTLPNTREGVALHVVARGN